MNNNKIFRFALLIKEHHLDTFHHVNNATYLRLLEEARWEFLNEQGINFENIQRTGIGPVILECNIKFLKELKLRESIIIESQMLAFENKVGIMRQDIFNAENVVCSHAKITFGVFDIQARKLILPNQQWSEALGLN